MKASETIKEITTSMVNVQAEIKGIAPNANNPFFKSSYITLDNILEIIRPILTKNQVWLTHCLLYTSPSPRDLSTSRMPSSA